MWRERHPPNHQGQTCKTTKSVYRINAATGDPRGTSNAFQQGGWGWRRNGLCWDLSPWSRAPRSLGDGGSGGSWSVPVSGRILWGQSTVIRGQRGRAWWEARSPFPPLPQVGLSPMSGPLSAFSSGNPDGALAGRGWGSGSPRPGTTTPPHSRTQLRAPRRRCRSLRLSQRRACGDRRQGRSVHPGPGL